MHNAPMTEPPAPAPYIPSGTIVRVLADGTIGEVTWAGGQELRIVHGHHAVGRGPWVMLRGQCVPATDAEAAAYHAACSALRARIGDR